MCICYDNALVCKTSVEGVALCWREKGWITGYPTGNSQRGKYYFKRSELETASAMDDIGNALPANKIFKNLF